MSALARRMFELVEPIGVIEKTLRELQLIREPYELPVVGFDVKRF